MGGNRIGATPYAIDVEGDGRSALYSSIDAVRGTAQLAIQDQLLVDNQPPYAVLPTDSATSAGFKADPLQTYISYREMVDFNGTGKPTDVRWSLPYFRGEAYNSENGEYAGGLEWENLLPQVVITDFRKPGTARVGQMAAYYPHGEYPAPACGISGDRIWCNPAPYYFDVPLPGGGLTGDFTGSGYSNLLFGFVEVSIDGATQLAKVTRKEQTLCLSTGRNLDCAPVPQHSGDKYKFVRAIGNFVGDGQPSVLIEKSRESPDFYPVPTGELEMCRVTGMGTAANDIRMSCADWSGLTLLLPTFSPTAATDQMLFLDLYGTGRTQVVIYRAGKFINNQWSEAGNWEVYEPQDVSEEGQALDRIHQVTNGLGSVSSVTYADGLAHGIVVRDGNNDLPASNYPQHLAPQAGKIVSQLSVGNGHVGNRVTNYRYADAAIDVAGRGSLGFGTVTATDADTGIETITRYSQRWPYNGMVRSTTVRSGTVTLAQTDHVLAHKQQPGAQARYFPYVSTTNVVRKDLNNSDLGTIFTSFTYDDFGNLLTRDETATGNGKYESKVTTSYKNRADADNWIIGLPETVTTWRKNGESSELERKLAYTYTTKGLLETETIESGDLALQVVTRIKRDGSVFGVETERTQTWRDPVSKADVSRYVKTTYDDNGRFPSKIERQVDGTAANDLTESLVHFAANGALALRVDANNLRYSWSVDGFGRVTKEVRPDGTETLFKFKRCAGACSEASGAAAVQITEYYYDGKQIAAPRLIFTDAVGHVLRTQSYAFDGTATYVEQRYDSQGRLNWIGQPTFAGVAATMASSTEYDILNRPVTQSVKHEDGFDKSQTTAYNGFEVTQTNARTYSRTEKRNVLGQVQMVTDAEQGVTEFGYDPFGNLNKTIDPNKNVIKVEYDKLGRRTALVDPDLGRIEYAPDPLGRVLTQSSPVQRAGGHSTEFRYDLLGRMTSRTERDMNAVWVFDTAPNGKGQLAQAYTRKGSATDYQRVHSYDRFGRPSLTTQVLDNISYSSEVRYDDWGRPVGHIHRRGSESIKEFSLRYNDKGHLASIERKGQKLWEVTEQDAAHRPRKIKLGNGLTQETGFHPQSGRLIGDNVVVGVNGLRVQQSYVYDALGNVEQRSLHWDIGGFMESFEYDRLNRLQSSKVGSTEQIFTYYADGSIKSKSGVGNGDYRYPRQGSDEARPHAVKSIDGIDGEFVYDINGNMTSSPAIAGVMKTASWTTFDMPKSISKGSAQTSQFSYGPELQRTIQRRNDGGNETVFVYAGAQEVEVTAGARTIRTYWPNGIGFEVDKIENGVVKPTQLLWAHKDRLGSVIALSGSNGNLEERMAYDAWGKRSNLSGTASPDDVDGELDNKGFTGHEMLDKLDLVHMNGRVYDPFTARFMSGDPIIQDPMNGQNYSRYSYVFNNPTNLVDPTGFQTEIIRGERVSGQSIGDVFARLQVLGYQGAIVKVRQEAPTGTRIAKVTTLAVKFKESAIKGDEPVLLYSQPQQQAAHSVSLAEGASRALTKGEEELGKTVYPTIDYSLPMICRCKAYFFQPDDRAMSPDGNIYFHPNDKGYYDDFSKAPVSAQHTFIHELGHVYQTQNGENVRSAAFDRNYSYWPLAPGKTFMQYGLEQRAEMVADYFMLKRHGQMWQNMANQNPRPTAADYEQVVPHKYQP